MKNKPILNLFFFLHTRSKGGTKYLNFFLGKAYYRDMNLYFVYDKQNK